MHRIGGSVVLLCLLAAAAGCRGGIKDTRITEQNKKTVFQDIKDSRDLTVEEVGLLQAFVIRKGLGDALTGKTPELPVGMTIGEMIEDQRQWVADSAKREADEKERVARARAEEERQRKALLDALTVTVYDKGYSESDYREYITIKTMYENKSGKDIRGFKGIVQFNDLFGAEIMPLNISEDSPLKNGETKNQTWTLKYNQFIDKHMKLRGTELGSLKVEWKPQIILFADGTSLEAKAAS
jgi:hypothetical protein